MKRRLILSIAATLISLLLFSSCQQTLNVTTFEPKLEIQGGINEVVNGSDFTFGIYSATGKIIINSLEIRSDQGELAYATNRAVNSFPIQGITTGNEISCGEDGWARFSAASVQIPAKAIYTLTAIVSEPSTSNKVTLKGTFRGRTSLDAGEVSVTGFCSVKNGSVITSGDILNVSTVFSKRGFRLDKIHLPEGCHVIEKGDFPVAGKEYNLPDDKTWRFSVSCDNISQDVTDSLSFDVTDTDSGKKTHMRYAKDIECRYPFKFSLSCENVRTDDGILKLVITTNRITFTPTLLEVTPEREDALTCNSALFSKSNKSFDFFNAHFADEPEKTLTVGTREKYGNIESREPQNLVFTADGIRSSVDQTISLRFGLMDAQTEKTEYGTCSFDIGTSSIPVDMEVFYSDGNNMVKVLGRSSYYEDMTPIYVGFYDNSPEGAKRGVNDVCFRFLSADGEALLSDCSYDVSVSNSSYSGLLVSRDGKEWKSSLRNLPTKDGVARLYFRGGKAAGEHVVSISVVNPRTGKTVVFPLKLFVGYRCAIVIDADVRDKLFGYQGQGWRGVLSNIGAEIKEYSSLNGSTNNDPLYDYMVAHSSALNCSGIDDFVIFKSINLGTGSIASASFSANMKWVPGHPSPWFYQDGKDSDFSVTPITYLYVDWWKESGRWTYNVESGSRNDGNWPKIIGSGAVSQCVATTEKPTLFPDSFLDEMNRYNDNCRIAHKTNGDLNYYEDLYDNTAYRERLWYLYKMSFSTRDVAWTDRSLDIRYVVYRFKKDNTHWWHIYDEGVWYQNVDDIPIR